MHERIPVNRAATVALVFLLLCVGTATASGADRPEVSIRSVPELIQPHSQALVADPLVADPGPPIGGNPDGDVTLAMFFDYNCGCCRGFARELVAVEHADPGLRVVYLELPILGARSAFAARAALAAGRQNAYVMFHQALMASRGYTSPDAIVEIAEELLLDADQLQIDMAGPEIERMIEDNLGLARNLGIQGTPAFVLGDRLIQGALPRERLAALIAEERSAAKP